MHSDFEKLENKPAPVFNKGKLLLTFLWPVLKVLIYWTNLLSKRKLNTDFFSVNVSELYWTGHKCSCSSISRF